VGRTFVHPAFDYLVIGGGLSVAVGLLALTWSATLGLPAELLAALIIVSNNAHFAASSLRLYTRPDAVRTWPFLTLGFPLVAIAVGTAAIMVPEPGGFVLWTTYQAWVPYHYSAQAFGLALMYAYRSGAQLDDDGRRWLRWACFLPFVWSLLQPQGAIGQVLQYAGVGGLAGLAPLRTAASTTLAALVFVAPLAVFVRLARGRRLPMPLISLLVVYANAIWWILFTSIDAFYWATVFHGAQYLAIVTVFHVKDRQRQPGVRRPAYQALGFYGANLALGLVLFQLWPHAYGLAGFNLEKSVLLVTAVVNIHHFVVDAYIWRLRRDPNYRTVVEDAVPAHAA
jgi:hypothetical protein